MPDKKGKSLTAAVSKKTLQLIHGSARKVSALSRYRAATIRGTIGRSDEPAAKDPR